MNTNNHIQNQVRQGYLPFYGAILLFFGFYFSSCVSFNFDSLKDKKARGVTFKAPMKPYKKIVKKGMDFAWENPESGHTLSFFSNCSSTDHFTSLKQFRKDLLDGLKSFHILDEREMRHQGQKAYLLRLIQKSSLLKVMSMSLFLFKKVDCFYTISFLMFSSGKNTTDHQSVFENFIKEFRAP